MQKPLKILTVEDSEDDALLLELEFKKSDLQAEFTRVDTSKALLSALEQDGWDIVLSDYAMPHFSGMAALQTVREKAPDLPVIFVSGTIGEDIAVEAMRAGASDYLMKGHLKRLVPAVKREIGDSEVRLARKQAETALISSQAELAAIYEHAPMVMALWDENLKMVRLNRTALKLLDRHDGVLAGIGPGDVLHCAYSAVDPQGCGFGRECEFCGLRRVLMDTLTTGRSYSAAEIKIKIGQQGSIKETWALVSTARMMVEEKPRVLLCVEDITEKKQLEKQYLHAQRMEAVGTLASGIAHDLNNILAPMMMAGELMKGDLTPVENKEIIDMFERGAKRGADIIRQLLMFSRGVEGARVPVQLRHLLKEMVLIMRETFPRNLVIEEKPANDLWTVQADATQLHQVLMNLCVNARDAMPDGGTLTVSAKNINLNENEAKFIPQAKAGPYVIMTVEDTGQGIPPEIVHRIFDPFFTTKEVGKGSGLGLSTVLGIVRKHEGFVQVDTGLGRGSTFKVYLPATPAGIGTPTRNSSAPFPVGNGELILVVDDEASIRTVLHQLLVAYHYRVLVASNGKEAMDMYLQYREELRVVVTDLMMPVMDGITLVRSLRDQGSNIEVIAVSGKDIEEHSQQLKALGVTKILMKPCEPKVFLEAIRQSLSVTG